MAAGRPLEYEGDVTVKKAEQYLESCTAPIFNADSSGTLPKELPTIEGLALHLDIARTTVYDWKEKYPAFSYIFEKVMANQSKKLVNNGLLGAYNSTITKVMLTKHGYHDVSESNLKNDGGKFEAGEMSPAMLAITKEFEAKMKKEVLK